MKVAGQMRYMSSTSKLVKITNPQQLKNKLSCHAHYLLLIFLGIWSSPTFTGSRPPPCADFSLTNIDHYRAALYGGDRGINKETKDVYLIDFGTKVLWEGHDQSMDLKQLISGQFTCLKILVDRRYLLTAIFV